MSKPIEIFDVKVAPALKLFPDSPRTATVKVKGVTPENYNDNRVFGFQGQRWVLQGWFGVDCMEGVAFYSASQHDAGDNFAERVAHIARN